MLRRTVARTIVLECLQGCIALLNVVVMTLDRLWSLQASIPGAQPLASLHPSTFRRSKHETVQMTPTNQVVISRLTEQALQFQESWPVGWRWEIEIINESLAREGCKGISNTRKVA